MYNNNWYLYMDLDRIAAWIDGMWKKIERGRKGKAGENLRLQNYSAGFFRRSSRSMTDESERTILIERQICNMDGCMEERRVVVGHQFLDKRVLFRLRNASKMTETRSLSSRSPKVKLSKGKLKWRIIRRRKGGRKRSSSLIITVGRKS